MAEFKLHDLASAEKALRRALELDPRSGSVLYNLGVVSLELKKPREALGFLKTASEIGPQNAALAINLVRAHLDNGLQDEALSSLKLAPNLPDIPYSLAVSYFIADDFDQAAEYVSQAIRLDPKDDRALFLLGISLFARNKLQEGQKYLGQAIRLKPRNPFYQCFEGMLLASDGQDATAEQRFYNVLAIDPSYALAHYQLARLYRVSDAWLVQRHSFWPREPLRMRSGEECRSGGFCGCMYDLT